MWIRGWGELQLAQDDSTTAANLEKLVSQGMAMSKDAKQPNCPEEKEKAIVEALKHFGMVI